MEAPPLIIIPAAGFGTRINPGADESFAKELLIDPQTGKPLICWGIDLALKFGYDVHVITREPKSGTEHPWPGSTNVAHQSA